MVVIGFGGFIYSVFNFQSRTSKGLGLPSFGETAIQGVEYYYDDTTRLILTFSAMFVVTGYFVLKNKR